MSDVVIDPNVSPVIPPVPPPTPIVPVVLPLNPEDIKQYEDLFLSLLSMVIKFIPAGQFADMAKKIDVIVHTMVSQQWFNELLVVIINLIRGGKAPTRDVVFKELMQHLVKSGVKPE